MVNRLRDGLGVLRFISGFALGACGVVLAGLLLNPSPSATDRAIDEQRARAERIEAEHRVVVEQSLIRVAADAERVGRELSAAHRRIVQLEGSSQIAVGTSERVVVLVGDMGSGLEKAYRLSEILDDAIRGSSSGE